MRSLALVHAALRREALSTRGLHLSISAFQVPAVVPKVEPLQTASHKLFAERPSSSIIAHAAATRGAAPTGASA